MFRAGISYQAMAKTYRVGDPVSSGTSEKKAGPKPRAVFVAHGMGQQVPFATLDDVARGLCDTTPNSAQVKEITANTVRVGCEVVQRLEITFENDALRPIHIFEAYWAPLTEGAVGIWQVIRFLLLGGFNGIRSGGKFHRFMFGSDRVFTIASKHMAWLGFTVVLVLGFVILGSVSAVVGAGSLLVPGWIPEELVRELTVIFELLLAVIIAAVLLSVAVVLISRRWPTTRWLTLPIGLVLALAVILTAYVRIPLALLFHLTMPFPWPQSCAACGIGWGASLREWAGAMLYRLHEWMQWVCSGEWWVWWLMLAAAAAVLLYALVRAAVRSGEKEEIADAQHNIADARRNAEGQWWGVAIAVLLVALVLAMCGRSDAIALATWVLLLAATLFVRAFLIQYVGDVAAYVSPHVVDRFFDLRQRIRDRAWRAAWAVYALRDKSEFVYDDIAIVGHSLGAVVVYDTLNRLLNEDKLAENMEKGTRCGDFPVESLNVKERTKLLLTFGAPLDKTAFIFAMHDRGGGSERDALATSVQPLICEERTLKWVNVYSRWDILGGSLEFYDTPKRDNQKPVENCQDPDAVTPLAAHVEFWNNPLIYKMIHRNLP
jgi:hypothetical protein